MVKRVAGGAQQFAAALPRWFTGRFHHAVCDTCLLSCYKEAKTDKRALQCSQGKLRDAIIIAGPDDTTNIHAQHLRSHDSMILKLSRAAQIPPQHSMTRWHLLELITFQPG